MTRTHIKKEYPENSRTLLWIWMMFGFINRKYTLNEKTYMIIQEHELFYYRKEFLNGKITI